MDNHYTFINQNQERKTNIYINPYFNRADNVSTALSNVYFNPNFSHVTPNLYHCGKQDLNHHGSKSIIHINPNFIRNANMLNPIIANSPVQPIKTSYSISNSTGNELKKIKQDSSIHITKSRYCLVNQKDTAVAKSRILSPVTATVRVNKYKSVSMNVVKKNLASAKPTNNIILDATLSQNKKYKQKVSPINTRFKFVKHNNATVVNHCPTNHVVLKKYSVHNKTIQKTTSRKINHKFVLKINNVPCPLFKKYGKCLRKIRGNCEYLHDKKHVSICRNFLKGICHDVDCLLSHDLTDKKMPTCYFYLKGACTKESCPYLHIKLNEKTKICQDFLKGYCEKGDKCLFRHINVCRNLATKCSQRLTKSTANRLKIKYSKSLLEGQGHKNVKNKDNRPTEEQRYFKESVEKTSSDENMIKPIRIKLGTLPSFIQL